MIETKNVYVISSGCVSSYSVVSLRFTFSSHPILNSSVHTEIEMANLIVQFASSQKTNFQIEPMLKNEPSS